MRTKSPTSGPAPVSMRTLLAGHVEICRFDHWIKNIFVLPGILIPLTFEPRLVDWHLAGRVLLGFTALGLAASSNYVLNEILDAPSDRQHPQKSARPVPAGRVHVPLAYLQWLVLMLASLGLAGLLSLPFVLVLALLLVMGCVYNIPPLRTKDVPYLDVLSEAINNPLRFLAGWAIVGPAYFPSTNLLLSYWMLGCYLMALKRYAEFRDIADPSRAAAYRKSFKYYSEERLLIMAMFYASASMLFLGAFIMRYKIELILSFPFIAWVMALYMHLAMQKDSPVQAPEKLYRESLFMSSVVLCSFVMILLFAIRIPQIGALFTPTMPIPNPHGFDF